MSKVRRRTSSLTGSNQKISLSNSSNGPRPGTNCLKTSAKKVTLTKPAWDSTNSDLNQLKLSNEELERRRKSHQSKNLEVVMFEKQRQNILKENYKDNKKQSQFKTDNSKAQLALLKEILYDDNQLKNLLLKSDNTLQTVKNFFNSANPNDSGLIDSNNKKQVKINMTLAPNVTDLNESNLPFEIQKKRNKNTHKQVELKPRLNNANSVGSIDGSDENEEPSSDNNSGQNDNQFNLIDKKLKSLKSSNDMDKVKSLLELKQILAQENEKIKQPQSDLNQLNLSDLEDCLKILSNNINSNKEKISLLKLKNGESSEKDGENVPSKTRHSTLSTLDDEFRKSLNDLELKFLDFEKQNGKKKSNENDQKIMYNQQQVSTSSYTLSLIKMISKLVDYLKETQLELNHEKLKQTECNKQLDIHRKLIDGLTTEILCVKEQNEKIINDYVNQQAKFEAELDHIKNMFRTSVQINNNNLSLLNESRQRSFSAFQSTSLNNNNPSFIHKPMALLPSQQQQQQLPNNLQPRPMSCMSSLNHTNELSNFNTEQSSNNDNHADKFAERLNAMLQYDQIIQGDNLAGCLSKSTSLANFQQLFQTGPNNKQLNQSSNNRSISAQFQNTSMTSNDSLFNVQNYTQSNNLNKFNGTSNQDLSMQIQELSNKNMQAQQKLKLLQLEQHQINQLNSKSQHSQSFSSTISTSIDETHKQKNQRDALDKLKREQMQLKEQINNLNKQRESAQNELEVLASSSNTSFKNNDAQKAILKHLNQLNENVVTLEHELNDNTPSLSPIQPEHNFQS